MCIRYWYLLHSVWAIYSLKIKIVCVHCLKMGKAIWGYIKLVDNPQHIPYSDNLRLFIKLLAFGNVKIRGLLPAFLYRMTASLSFFLQSCSLPFVGQGESPDHLHHSCYYFLHVEDIHFLRVPVFIPKPGSIIIFKSTAQSGN